MLSVNKNVNTEKTLKITILVDQFGDQLYNWACRQVKDESIAQDLVQEAFISAFQNFEKFNGITVLVFNL